MYIMQSEGYKNGFKYSTEACSDKTSKLIQF